MILRVDSISLRRGIRWSCLLFLLAASIQLTGATALAQAVDARVASVKGTALRRNNQRAFILARGDSLNPGDEVDTRGGGRVVIELTDGSVVVVHPNSRIIISNYRAAASLREMFRILIGRVRVKVAHYGGKPNPYRVNSPTASILVRGTEFSVAVEPSGDTRVEVYDGLVEVQSLSDPSRRALLPAGRGALVKPNEDIQFFTPGSGDRTDDRGGKNDDADGGGNDGADGGGNDGAVGGGKDDAKGDSADTKTKAGLTATTNANAGLNTTTNANAGLNVDTDINAGLNAKTKGNAGVISTKSAITGASGVTSVNTGATSVNTGASGATSANAGVNAKTKGNPGVISTTSANAGVSGATNGNAGVNTKTNGNTGASAATKASASPNANAGVNAKMNANAGVNTKTNAGGANTTNGNAGVNTKTNGNAGASAATNSNAGANTKANDNSGVNIKTNGNSGVNTKTNGSAGANTATNGNAGVNTKANDSAATSASPNANASVNTAENDKPNANAGVNTAANTNAGVSGATNANAGASDIPNANAESNDVGGGAEAAGNSAARAPSDNNPTRDDLTANATTSVRTYLTNDYERYADSLAGRGWAIPLQRFSAFADSHFDSLDNPAYATEFASIEGRAWLIPFFNKSRGGALQSGSAGFPFSGNLISPFDSGLLAQADFFIPLEKVRMVIGGAVAISSDRSQSLAVDQAPASLRRLLPGGGQASRYIAVSTDTTSIIGSLVVARRFGDDGRTSVGAGVEWVSEDGGLRGQTSLAKGARALTIEELEADSQISRLRFRLGVTRKFDGGHKLGLVYSHELANADDRDRSRFFAGGPLSLDSGRQEGRSSEVSFRLRGPLTRRLFYGLEGSLLWGKSDEQIRRSVITDSTTRADVNSAAVGFGVGFALRRATVLSADFAFGLSGVREERLEEATGNSVEDRRERGRFVSGRFGLQTDVWRQLFASASTLVVGQSATTDLDLRPDLFGRRLTSLGLIELSGRSRWNSTSVFSDFGAGWRINRYLLAEYIFSINNGLGPTRHVFLLRYTFKREE